MHNKNVFQKTLTQTFTFLVGNVHLQTCPCHFKLIKFTISNNLFALRSFFVKKKMLLELHVENYKTCDAWFHEWC